MHLEGELVLIALAGMLVVFGAVFGGYVLVLNDFEETVRTRITPDGKTYVYRDGEGYRSALEQMKGQPEPITP